MAYIKAVFVAILLCAFNRAAAWKNPSAKGWWSKRLTSDDYFTAGRLTERNIKYGSEDGFKSIVSLFYYSQPGGLDNGAVYPDTDTAAYTATVLAEVDFATVLAPGISDWKNTQTVAQLAVTLTGMARPVLYYSDYSYAATFTLLAHFANQTTLGITPPDDLEVSAWDVFNIGTYLGFNFGEDPELIAVITAITGQEVSDPPSIPLSKSDWYTKYWMLKPVYANRYVAGHIEKTYLLDVEKMEPFGWTNARLGMITPPDEPSQETVNLLNINGVDTYQDGGRQTAEVLEQNRLDPDKPNEYISPTSTVNYESRNYEEFGDEIGYNEDIEEATVIQQLETIEYSHVPIGGEYGYTTDMWDAYRDAVIGSGTNGDAIHKCSSGYRGSTLALLAVGELYGFGSAWVEERARQMGYLHSQEVIDLWKSVLD